MNVPAVRLSSVKMSNEEKAAGPPRARSEDATVVMHDREVKDPYHWLDNETPEVKGWATKQNNHSRRVLDGIDSREGIRERLRELENEEHVEAPMPSTEKLPSGKRRYFQFRQGPEDEYKILYYMDGLNGEQRVAIDPNKFSKNKTTSLIDWFPYDDGSIVAYSTSDRGSDVTTIHVVDLETGKVLNDRIDNVTFASVAWPNREGFYYSKWPDPKNHPDPKSVYQVYYHKLGTDQSRDKGIFGWGLGADKSCGVDIDTDGRYLLIYLSDNVDNDVYYKKLRKNSSPEIKPLVTGHNASFHLGVVDGVAYTLTDLDAPNSRIIKFDMNRPSEKNWKTIVEEKNMPIENAFLGGSSHIVKYLKDGYSVLREFSPEGRLEASIRLPMKGVLTFPNVYRDSEFFVTMGSLVSPTQMYKVNMSDYTFEKIGGSSSLDMSKYELKQEWFESKDGTRIPMFIMNKKGVKKNGKNPTILYGYGGFGLATEPEFDHRILPFLDDGGIWVMANIRGGGEYGRSWYEAGMHKNQQNSFDDFVGAAEWLIKNRYTNRDRLAIRGRSNGGLLTAAVMVQRPDLFKAVISEMPVTDMLSAHRFDIGPLCKREFGDPEKAEDFEFMAKYSPYHNVKDGEKYPSLLVICGENDTRCDPMHARKFAAAVQNATSSGNPVLFLMQRDIGHGGATMSVRKSQQLEWTTDWLAFVYKELGMEEDIKRRRLEQLKRSG